jgi:hypothetical protein
MKKIVYGYKRYLDGIEDYFEYEIEASNKVEALLSIVATHEGIGGSIQKEKYKKTKAFIAKELKNKWHNILINNEIEYIISKLNPLGSPSTALYRIDYIKEL